MPYSRALAWFALLDQLDTLSPIDSKILSRFGEQHPRSIFWGLLLAFTRLQMSGLSCILAESSGVSSSCNLASLARKGGLKPSHTVHSWPVKSLQSRLSNFQGTLCPSWIAKLIGHTDVRHMINTGPRPTSKWKGHHRHIVSFFTWGWNCDLVT